MKEDNIKIFLTDCDGVMTDGGMYYFEDGNEAKKFNTKDGFAFSTLRRKNIKIGIITGENTDIVKNRAKKLKMNILYLGVDNKLDVINEICKKYKVNYSEILYVGDDINDIDSLKKVGIAMCPSDANKKVKKICKYITKAKGGKGVIREIVDKYFK